ncbi:carbohydrate ABC transporter permease [Halopenitus persicus]|uniref:Maltose ABC transporter membrane protein /trehalose ABC transporter membrane protein /sucrose ABC transporter membrane protein /palatinose ABC transporter membrane protein n=1 Tax=Halopenitus persicus TaxID=1048396 RepID=A0A1H3LWA9_9EURY|nr:sugar ABC transporter permease [Halopenitus persicus]SDY68721.1 maltose ABC transporter membrane protein /trehalose ABC transporter membrane protein /sucrose ABC transporter membrane protein /palatinose ABC transporter membrane protein [Halopenitus persicus]
MASENLLDSVRAGFGRSSSREDGEIGPIREFINDHFMFFVLTPPLLVLGTLVLLPSSYLLWSSVHEARTWGPDVFVGLENYIAIFQDPMFYLSLRHSVMYVIGSVSLAFVLGLTAALAINQVASKRIRSTFTVLILLAWAVPLVVTGLIWRFMLHSDYGIVNALLVQLGIVTEQIGFVTDPTLAFLSVVVVDAWARAPFATILLLAGLQTIPEDLYEAARVDGANFFQKFRDITIPHLKPQAAIALVIMCMFAFRTFSVVFALTGGGPANSTRVLATYIYQAGINQGDVGYAAALSVLMIAMTMVFITFYVLQVQEDALDTA